MTASGMSGPGRYATHTAARPEAPPPFSREAEKGVIGSVLRDNTIIPGVLARLRSHDFYMDAHQRIFLAVIALHAAGKPVDTVILFEELRRRKQIEDVGGAEYLADLWDAAPTSANWKYHCDIIRDKATARSLIHHSTELIRDTYDGVESAADLLARTREKFDRLDADRARGTNPLPRVRYADVKPLLFDNYLIKKLLPRTGLAMFLGPSGSGKSFSLIDVAGHVAAGLTWRGRRVKGGAVLYVAAEAGVSILNRVEAWKREHGLTDVPLHVVPCAVDLFDPNADVQRVIDAAKALADETGVAVVMVVVDTVSRSFGSGDENGPDMVKYVRNLDRIRDALQALVLVAHHPGKDLSRGARGHVSITNATDVVVEFAADDGTKLHTAKVVRVRDGEVGETFAFKLKPVELGRDEDGEPVTTCVVVEADATDADPRADLTADERSALNVLVNLAASGGWEQVGTPVGRKVVTVELWRKEFYSKVKPGAKSGTKRQAFNRASSRLIAAKLVYCIDPWVWPDDPTG